MKAIILAAGVGQRLGEISGGLPKCLLEFEGISLLHRHILLLEQFGIEELLVITGYREEKILENLNKLNSSIAISTICNPDFTEGSVISLLSAKAYATNAEDILLMDADVLYDPDILKRLITSVHNNCLLLDRDFIPGDEPVKICVLGTTMVDFRKKIDNQLKFDFQGESVGFFRFNGPVITRLFDRCQHYIDSNDRGAPYEEIIRDLLLETPTEFHYEDVSGLSWIEIDFPEDVERASTEVLNNINKRKNKFNE